MHIRWLLARFVPSRGETVVNFRITGITLNCGSLELTVDGKVVAPLPDDPAIQSGQVIVKLKPSSGRSSRASPRVASSESDRPGR
jgi:hypothetical protein